MLRHLIEHADPRTRSRLLQSLALAARIRGRREVMGMLPLGAPAGEKRRTIYNAKHGTKLPGDLVRGEGDPPASDDAVNEAYDGLGATYDLYSEEFQRNSIDGKGMRLDASVHYDNDFNNAFWDGRQMVFGDGDGQIFIGFTKAIDVIGHELTHGVTQYESALEYHDQPGALNESFSDVFGSLVKQKHLNQAADSADWLIGEGILGPNIHGVALRSMKDPGSAYDDPLLGKDPQPGHMKGYDKTTEDNGGVHINSGIPNHAFYFLATALGGYAYHDAGQIWYLTLRRLNSEAQFQDCADVSFQSAAELFGQGSTQQQAVQIAWDKVGIKVTARLARTRPSRAPAMAAADGADFGRQVERLADELTRVRECIDALVERLAEGQPVSHRREKAPARS
jgi:Zn-dependent metalloprotease